MQHCHIGDSAHRHYAHGTRYKDHTCFVLGQELVQRVRVRADLIVVARHGHYAAHLEALGATHRRMFESAWDIGRQSNDDRPASLSLCLHRAKCAPGALFSGYGLLFGRHVRGWG